MRQQEDALASLRIALAADGVRFDRFDIAYAVLWQRLHPHLQINRVDLSFVNESDVLGNICDSVSGLSLFGTAASLLQLAARFAGGARRKYRISHDETLSQLDELTNQELVDAVTYLFAEDLRQASEERSYCVFVDAYEALVPSPLRTARTAMADAWLRDLIAQLDRGLTVVASREPLGWAADDPAWSSAIRSVGLDALPMPARIELLAACGVTDEIEQREIATASQGLPFYLNLAIDTRTRPSPAQVARVVRRSDILRRFLQHVGDREARVLELLALSRVFDFEIFHTLARAFSLPDDRFTWETLAAYSFVYPAGESYLRLHQLMRDSLQDQLSPAVRADIAARLYDLWAERAQRHAAAPQDVESARATREMVYHGLQAGKMTGVHVLTAADAAFRLGGRAACDGIGGDLSRHLSTSQHASADLAEAATCLQAEAAMRLSDSARALAVTDGVVVGLDSVVGARLMTAVGDAKRTLGDTTAAREVYQRIWQEHPTAARNDAGIWLADLDMCQGRFPEAISLAEQILGDATETHLVVHGGAHRLLHLTYRFACDFDASAAQLSIADDCYRRAGSAIGLAKLATNRAELLAWRNPPAALEAAARALEVQRNIGDQAEIGKIYTAIAIGHLGLGQVGEAHVTLHSANAALDRARYRSGRARAELIRACAFAAVGDVDRAAAAASWAVRELIVAEVYPTLLILAQHLLHLIGVPDETIDRAATTARGQIHPLVTIDQLDAHIHGLVVGLIEGTR
jgi:tetratricopeptide (TPR) repeat protein